MDNDRIKNDIEQIWDEIDLSLLGRKTILLTNTFAEQKANLLGTMGTVFR